jgi:hypothetical protein
MEVLLAKATDGDVAGVRNLELFRENAKPARFTSILRGGDGSSA